MIVVQQVAPQVQSLPIWIEYVRALGTPIAALIGAGIASVIAHRQMLTARNKLKLDLFEKRVEVYEAASDYISLAGQTNEMEEARGEEIIRLLNTASWLLDEKVQSYLQKLSTEVRNQRQKIRTARTSDEKIALVSENKDFRKKHREELREAFAPFLKLQH